MAGLWDGVPASPCSGASDDVHARHAAPRRSLRATSSPFAKRSRFAPRPSAMVTAAAFSPDSSVVEFVGASTNKDDKDAKLVAKLNITAADERKKALLTRLRLIDERKANLRKIAAQSSADSVGSVIEAATPEPQDVVPGESNALSALNEKSNSSRNLPSMQLDLSKANKESPRDLNRFTKTSPSPSPSLQSVYGSVRSRARATPSSRKRSSALTHADLPSRPRSSRRASRPRTPSVLLQGMPGDTVLSQLPVGVLKCKRYTYCKKVISLLLKNSSAGPFSAPVKELWHMEAIPRYFDVITKPMDLGTVKKNMEGTKYLNPAESNPLLMFKPDAFAEDIRLVFRNAMVYNSQGDMLYNCAKDLLEEFLEMFTHLPPLPTPVSENKKKRLSTLTGSAGSSKRGRISELPLPARGTVTSSSSASRRAGKVPTKKFVKPAAKPVKKQALKVFKIDENMTTRQMKKRLDYLGRCRTALLARAPLPKGATFYDRAALLHDVPLDYTEKSRMSDGIHKLPTNKLNTFLNIIQGETDNDLGGDELEFDINELGTKTLRNIEAFLEVTIQNYKTIRNSDVGAEFSRAEEFEAEETALQKRLSQPNKAPAERSAVVSNTDINIVESVVEKDTEELYASSDSDSDSDSSDSDSSGSDSDSE